MKSSDKKTHRVHFRRCHLCDGITETQDESVTHCGHCGKAMAPFYFFDDREVPPLSDVELREDLIILLKPGSRTPLRGFTAYW